MVETAPPSTGPAMPLQTPPVQSAAVVLETISNRGPALDPSFPHSRVKGTTFILSVPLPSKFRGNYDPSTRPPASAPILLQPGDCKHFTKPTKSKSAAEPKPKKARKTAPARKASTPRAQKESRDQKEYDRARNQTAERQEYHRQNKRKRDQMAKDTGKCRDCPNPANPGQTMCESCVKRHREHNRLYQEKKKQATNVAT